MIWLIVNNAKKEDANDAHQVQHNAQNVLMDSMRQELMETLSIVLNVRLIIAKCVQLFQLKLYALNALMDFILMIMDNVLNAILLVLLVHQQMFASLV